jgi:6,7-dimethyl-8-ribityllumazine synthase
VNTGRMKQGSARRSTVGRGLCFGNVVSRFHEDSTDRLNEGAERCLSRHGVRREDVQLVSCPGAFELPQVANLSCETGSYDAIICLGAVLRGGSPHFEYVSSETARGIQQVALHHVLPVTFGVLTTDALEQAHDRVGGSQGNKGWDAAQAAISMATFFQSVQRSSGRKRVD